MSVGNSGNRLRQPTQLMASVDQRAGGGEACPSGGRTEVHQANVLAVGRSGGQVLAHRDEPSIVEPDLHVFLVVTRARVECERAAADVEYSVEKF